MPFVPAMRARSRRIFSSSDIAPPEPIFWVSTSIRSAPVAVSIAHRSYRSLSSARFLSSVTKRPSGDSFAWRGVGPLSEGLEKTRSRGRSPATAGAATATRSSEASLMRMGATLGGDAQKKRRSPKTPPSIFRLGKLLGFRGALGLGGRSVTADVAAFGDTSSLTGAATQVVELRTANVAAAHDLDLVDDRRIKREDALDALTERNLANGEAGADALVGAGDAYALERLHAGTVAFDHLHTDAQRVAGAEFGNGLLGGERVNGFALKGLDQVHFFFSSLSRRAPEGGACDAPPWRSIRSGRLSRVSSTARSCRHAAIFA